MDWGGGGGGGGNEDGGGDGNRNPDRGERVQGMSTPSWSFVPLTSSPEDIFYHEREDSNKGGEPDGRGERRRKKEGRE